jgi:PAS domain S-box-containing protein
MTTHDRPPGGWSGFQTIGGDVAAIAPATVLIGILDAVDVPVIALARDLTVACFNRGAADVFGLSPAHIGRAARDVATLAAMPRLEQQCRDAIGDGAEKRIDVRADRTSYVVRIAPSDSDRTITGIVLTFTNVTAFRASLDQAIYERECTKAILNAVADPIVVLSADQRIQSGNRAFYTMFALSRDEMQGLSLYALAHGVFAPVRQEIEGVLADTPAFQPIEVDHVLTERGPRTVLLDARPLSFPGHAERRVLLTFQDITARKQAEAAKDLRSEEELRRSEAFLAEAQRLSLTGSFSWNVATDAITWSEQLYRIFGFEPGTLVTLERIRSRIHPDDAAMVGERIERARSGGPDFEYSSRLLMPDGSVKYVNAIAHGIRDGDGRLEYLGAVQDVTQRRASEDALARARSELTAVARVSSLGVLTASIAHEVNQPLSGIVTNASTCVRMLDAHPPNIDGARETARRTIRDGNRASDVITRLRALFGQKPFSLESLDLNDATREVIALSASDLQRNRVVLQSELADGLPMIMGDRIQLQQVILNLLRNAADAMVEVDDRPRELLIRTERENDHRVRLTLKDAGVGLDPARVDELFDPFYTSKRDGMGVGLSISRSIIETHRGRIWAEPNDGPGATFAFSIPCDPQPTADTLHE